MSTDDRELYEKAGEICPWCGYLFRDEDKKLKHHATGKAYCDRNCYELDLKYPKEDRP